jgi:hypothetical protein
MVYVAPRIVRRNGHLVPAAIALFLAGLISPLHIIVFGLSWPLLWVPLAIVGLWPRQASSLPSSLILFVAGLWIDWVTLGAVGQWPLVFVAVYAFTRPDLAEPGRGLVRGLARSASALLIGFVLFALSGWFIYGVWPDAGVVAKGVVVFVLSLPVIILLRDLIAGRTGQDDF